MERERLTITLRRDILKLVDQSIDGAKLRNRSHAIEYFLSRELTSKSVRVVVALQNPARSSYQTGAAGFGGRASIAAARPLNFKGLFQNLAAQNFRDVLLVGTDSAALAAAAVDAEKIELSVKTESLELPDIDFPEKAFSKLGTLVKDETFVYWDSRFGGELNLSDLLDFHKSGQNVATAALVTDSEFLANVGVKGAIYGKRIIQVSSESRGQGSGLPLAGVLAFEPQVFGESNLLGKGLYQDILPALASAGKLNGFVFTVSELARQAVMAR